jgi:hypothetical protein
MSAENPWIERGVALGVALKLVELIDVAVLAAVAVDDLGGDRVLAIVRS